MKHIGEEELVLLYYREPGVPEEMRRHVRECGECRAAAQSLARTLDACSEWTIPEAAPDLGRSTWAAIAPRLEERPARRFFSLKFAVAAAAMAALVMAAYVAGRASRHPHAPSIMAGLSQPARDRILAISLADHLDRAEMLMTEISNMSNPDSAEFSEERGRAQDLVEEGRLMRQALARGGDNGTLSLLDEVERLMLEVANSSATPEPAEVKSLRERISSGSLLFKVRIIESNLRMEGQKS
jgi:hypothetical protein